MKEEKQKLQLERIELSNKPTLIIKEEFRRKVDFLHSKVGNYEWSGELITSEKGSISDLDDWKITAEDIFLVDIGSSAFTGYEVEKGAFKAADIAELYDKYPDLLEGKLKNHHIHTHHSMSAFFSTTDWDNLEDRAVVSNYFLMLIVNLSGEYKAKVAFKANVDGPKKTKINFANNVDGIKPLVLDRAGEKEALVVMDCNIIYEGGAIPEDFEKRYHNVRKAIDEEKKKKEKEHKSYNYKQSELPYNKRDHGEGNWSWGDWADWESSKKPKEKKIYDMTDKEWAQWEKNNQWQRKDFHLLMNCVLDNKVEMNFESIVLRLQDISKSLKTNIDMENLLTCIEFSLREYFDLLFLGKDDYDYATLMTLGMDILRPSKDSNRLIEEIFTILWTEYEDNTETAKDLPRTFVD